jgi:flagellum-specific ATP synthase
MAKIDWAALAEEEIARLPIERIYGRVSAVQGLLIEVAGMQERLTVGGRCRVKTREGRLVTCEAVGFRNGAAQLMALGGVEGIGLGCQVYIEQSKAVIYPGPAWLGRVVDALGRPVDGKGPLLGAGVAMPVKNTPPLASTRQRVGAKIDLGVKVLNSFVTCCRGQRMGIFAGSGVGKSSLMAMLSRYTQADINVIGLIGERGRELQEFIEDDLGAEGMARSVVVVATSDEAPLMRRQSAYTAMAVAEYFRDQGQHVLCMMDSITRFAMAQREIGLSAGEPPTSKGYPPTVFAELPRLLERAGPGQVGSGNITGLFTVLVDGDDHNEPIADAVRGILDGHIVLERQIAERGRYPAVNVLKSVSRTMPGCNSEAERQSITKARAILSTYEDMAEMIRLGAYRRGADPKVDEAIRLYPAIEEFLRQRKDTPVSLAEGYQQLAAILASA